MTNTGVIRKRCGCRDTGGRRLEQRCPELAERGHGSWYFHCSAANLLGRRERVRRGGYPSQVAARRARDEWLTTTAADRTAQGWTVERWLRHWLSTRTNVRPTTRFHYTRDADNVLIPRLGAYRLADLDARLLRSVFAQIAAMMNSKGRPQSASAMQHLRTTLRAALNQAVKEEVFGDASDYRLGRQASEREGWRYLGMGFAQALSNVDRHRIQKRDDAKRYALGVLGLGSLLLTQLRHEHEDILNGA